MDLRGLRGKGYQTLSILTLTFEMGWPVAEVPTWVTQEVVPSEFVTKVPAQVDLCGTI